MSIIKSASVLRYKGFEPVFDKNSEILILGSFPSVISRENGFYYGNKRNRFWNVLSKIFEVEIGNEKEKKTEFLLRHKIALWDIVETCEIEGALDSKIKNHTVVDLDTILNTAKINKIILNGKKAFKIFSERYSFKNLEIVCLPSTSPANISFDFTKWKNALKTNFLLD